MNSNRKRTLTLDLWIEDDNAMVEILEVETGDHVGIVIPYSPFEHPEFNERIGNELYSWLELMADEAEDWDSDEYIREHWDDILNSDKTYSEIAYAIRWGFSRGDLLELMRLHKENRNRQKIEDLLEDCNFHFECGNWHNGNYVIRED